MKFAIGVTYCGAGMEGWQSQPSGNTVQDHLSRALSEISGEPIVVTGAGRTDAGVHASAQVAHFETSVERPESARSEEHTSELQSLTNLVCRLLLEKKKKNKICAA